MENTNEETMICAWCGEECDPSDGEMEADMGFLCDQCIQAIQSRGETLNFIS